MPTSLRLALSIVGLILLSAATARAVTIFIAPEPTSMLLLGTGLIGIAGLARRKLKKRAAVSD